MTSEPGSFARSTITERKPQIIRQVMADNPYPPEIVAQLNDLVDEIATRPIQPVREAAPDVGFWNQALMQYPQCTWFEVPWYFAETYFYRRVLEAVFYFQDGDWKNYDPFQVQKRRQIETDIASFASEWDSFIAVEPDLAFETLLHSCLWGNRGDLSNFTVKVKALGRASCFHRA